MEVIIFIFYVVLCTFAIINIPFYKRAGIGKWLIGIFYIKILAGFAYAWFYKLPQYIKGADTWRFYHLSLLEKDWLLRDPLAFVKDLFYYGYAGTGNIFSGENSYWNDLKSNVVVKLIAIMNVLTGSSYYSNIILFNFVFLMGQVAIFRLFDSLYPSKKIWFILCIFLIPSTLFWCSGIHKDGLILSALGLLLYSFHQMLQQGRVRFKWVITFVVCLALIFFLRNYVLFALLPALAGWWLSYKWPSKTKRVFASIYFLVVILFFVTGNLNGRINLPAYVVAKQQEFRQLQGGSMVELKPLEPTIKSFIEFFPYAIDMAFLRPHFTEMKNWSYLPASFEGILLILILVTALFFQQVDRHHTPFLGFCIAFSITVFLVAGYTITFSGAIVRYRSLVLPFLVAPMLCFIDLKKVKDILNYKK